MKLLEPDKKILLNSVGWVNDSIVNAAQRLLKRQFPEIDGFQDVSLGLVLSFEVQTGDFLQILHANNHWLTVSTIACPHPSVKVYDSLYKSVPMVAKSQIASLFCTSNKEVQVSIMDVQKQVHTLSNIYKTIFTLSIVPGRHL